MIDIASRVARVREQIAAAAVRAQRDPAEVSILAISKRHPVTVIPAAYAAGIGDVGENFAQEMVAKLDELGAGPSCPGGKASAGLRWHFVGKLQRNKVKLLVGRAHLIHAVDNSALAAEISKRAAAAGIVQNLLIAVNMAAEASKSGVEVAGVKELLEAIDALPGAACKGLMTMPPLVADGEDNRRYFGGLRRLRDQLRSPARPLSTLSMGTSGDFEVAVEEGATLVRVGTAIFGPRPV
jgi:pyridoxal phosphate enzyme (YggS family)